VSNSHHPLTSRQSVAPLVIAVDCSTTAAKAIVVDRSGTVLSSGSSPLTTSSPRPGWHEQDAASWWPATRQAVATALSQLPSRRDIVAVCITHQRESFVCLDDEGHPLGPAILWHDSRAATEIDELGSSEVEQLCGKPADITPALYKLAWVNRHDPEQLCRAAHVVETHGLLVWEMTGAWHTSVSSADSLALLDVRTGEWADPLLELAGVRREQLSELRRPGEIIGPLLPHIAREWGLSSKVQVIAGLGDGQAAGLGAGVLDPGMAYLNLGTAVLIGTERLGYEPSRAYRSLVSVVDGHTTQESFISSGTYLPTWYRRRFGRPELNGAPDLTLEEAAGAVAPGSEGLLTLPYWNAAQAPYWDPHARGAVVGWVGTHGPEHLYRSLLEGVALALRQQLEGLEEANGQRISVLRTMGGGSRSRLWTDIVSGVLGRPLQRCAEDEISALGAGILAHVSVGSHADLGVGCAAMVSIADPVEPDAALVEAYEPLREIFADLYPDLQHVLHRLDRLGRSHGGTPHREEAHHR
jgi:xylulokinase